ncbi:HAD family hydrolase [Dyella sp.]|uniref:HAD family hydrolase n=1 Tax=Dyella sp. TaxID=1869338 RepID=UPI002ED26BF6
MNLALFDFDGTITTREMYRDFIEAAVPRARRVVGAVLFAPWVVGYKLGLVSGSAIRAAVVRFGFRGVEQVHVAEVGRRFAHDMLPGVLRPEVMARIQWHRDQGDRIIVVSGGLDLYLSHWCRMHGLEWLCTSLEARQGYLTGRHEGRQCVGEEKARRIRQALDLDQYPVIYAYGDTHEDHAMLTLAHRRYFRGVEVSSHS